jgi:hypothetical protein
VPDCPQSGALSDKRGILGEDLILEIFYVISLFQVLCSLLSLDELAIKMHRSLDYLEFLRENLHFEDYRFEEELIIHDDTPSNY